MHMNTMELVPKELKMSQSRDMQIFEMIQWNLDYKVQEPGLRMSITLRRKIMSEIMTTYFPSALLSAITFATAFFKPFFFEAALSVNLTTMLVMTTIFISKMEGLPPTSSIKMIDIWLILCQIYPFAEVVLLTAMEYNREEKKKGKKTNRKGKKKTKVIQATTLTVTPVIGNEVFVETKVEGLLSKVTMPSLKTLGGFIFKMFSKTNNPFCRNKVFTADLHGQLHHLLFCRCGALLVLSPKYPT